MVKLEIAIGDVVVRTEAAIDGEQLSRLIARCDRHVDHAQC